eukprot:TRINITY_DN3299_c0_g1_i1.p1 TRINITY_DN3299_c0_g1~~TRINITY_DN3299_c0_g1_i1.p1  ORF type:complete len:695 (-),score=139.08 TRINITY_DN3299_c0_g1_i1:530-2614(-)
MIDKIKWFSFQHMNFCELLFTIFYLFWFGVLMDVSNGRPPTYPRFNTPFQTKDETETEPIKLNEMTHDTFEQIMRITTQSLKSQELLLSRDEMEDIISPDNLVELLLSSDYLGNELSVQQLSHYFSYFKLNEKILNTLPERLVEEILVTSPLTELVSSDFVNEFWWKILYERHFGVAPTMEDEDLNKNMDSDAILNEKVATLKLEASPQASPTIQKYLKKTTSSKIIKRKSVSVSPYSRIKTPKFDKSTSKIQFRRGSMSPLQNVAKSTSKNLSDGQFQKIELIGHKNKISKSITYKSAYLTTLLQSTLHLMTVDATPFEIQNLYEHIHASVFELKHLRVSNPIPSMTMTLTCLISIYLPRLEILDISKNQLTGEEIEPILRVLQHTKIKHLNIGNNLLRTEGANALSTFLSKAKNLQILHAEHNAFGADGISLLVDGIENNQSLRKLALGYNQARTQGAKSLAKALQKNKTLTVLDFGTNSICDDGAVAFANLLRVNRSLLVLRIWDASMTPSGGNVLVDSIECNTVIQDVGIGHTALDEEHRKKLANLLHRNQLTQNASSPDIMRSPRRQLKASDDENTKLAKRRLYERELLYGADTVYSDVWYIIDEKWLSEWRKFCAPNSTSNPPGPISNDRLFLDDDNKVISPGLRKLYDYRGVCPQVFKIFYQIYGGGPPIVRRYIDIYSDKIDHYMS